MNHSNAKQFLPLVQAMADGKIIQYKNSVRNTWDDMECDGEISFAFPPDRYRIKPEITQVKGWIIVNRSTGRILGFSDECAMYYSKDSAEYRRRRTTRPDEWSVIEMAGNYER